MELPNSTGETPSSPPAPTMSLASRLFNVVAAPGEVFDAIKSAPVSMANWVVPALLLILVGWTGSFIVFSQDSINQQLTEMTDKALDKSLAKVPKDQAERVREQALKYAGIAQKAGAMAGPILAGFAWPFLLGLLIWLIGAKVFKGDFAFMKAVEMVGLSNMLVVIAGVLQTLLILVMDNIFAAPNLGLLVKGFDPQNPSHALLAAVNVMTFWVIMVRAIGLARLSKASVGKCAVWLFGLYALWTAFTVGLTALGRLFGGG